MLKLRFHPLRGLEFVEAEEKLSDKRLPGPGEMPEKHNGQYDLNFYCRSCGVVTGKWKYSSGEYWTVYPFKFPPKHLASCDTWTHIQYEDVFRSYWHKDEQLEEWEIEDHRVLITHGHNPEDEHFKGKHLPMTGTAGHPRIHVVYPSK